MQEYYEKNIQKYISEHSGEILIIDDAIPFSEHFFKTPKEADQYLSRYDRLYCQTRLTKKIPKSIKEYEKEKKDEFDVGRFLEYIKKHKESSANTKSHQQNQRF